MDILIVDIGTSYMKAMLFRNGVQFESWRDRTPQGDIDKIIDTALGFLNKATAEGYEINGTIVTSLSDCIVIEYGDGSRYMYWSDQGLLTSEGMPPYEVSGKSQQPGLYGMGHQLAWVMQSRDLDDIHRILPVSTYVASILGGDPNWNSWEVTHASNSGMFNMTSRGDWSSHMSPLLESNCICTAIEMPSAIVGRKDYMPVIIGGHDTTFTYDDWDDPYITVGTWVTVGKVQDSFNPQIYDIDLHARWLMDTKERMHEQLCIKSDDPMLYDKVSRFLLAKNYKNIAVVGSWANEFIILQNLGCKFDGAYHAFNTRTKVAQYAEDTLRGKQPGSYRHG